MIQGLNQEDTIIQQVLTQWGVFCNICGTKRSQDNIKIVRKTPEMMVLHIGCTNCGNAHFISFNYSSAGFAMQNYSSDLKDTEFALYENTPINNEDVINAYDAISKVQHVQELFNIIPKKSI